MYICTRMICWPLSAVFADLSYSLCTSYSCFDLFLVQPYCHLSLTAVVTHLLPPKSLHLTPYSSSTLGSEYEVSVLVGGIS